MLTDRCLVYERAHPHAKEGDVTVDGKIIMHASDWGTQRIYRYGDWGLSLLNGPIIHSFAFAWEAAVLRFEGEEFTLDYSTPLTSDVEVFQTDEEANEFIHRALDYFESLPIEKFKKALRKVYDERHQ